VSSSKETVHKARTNWTMLSPSSSVDPVNIRSTATRIDCEDVEVMDSFTEAMKRREFLEQGRLIQT